MPRSIETFSGLAMLRHFVIERRHYLKWRQIDMAERCSLSHAWVASFESGRTAGPPRRDTILRLAKGLCLARETPGLLLTFLEVLLTGRVSVRTEERVATAELDISVAIAEAMGEDRSLKIRTYDPALVTARLFHSGEARSARLEQALACIQEDLSPQDFAMASMLLRRLYEQPQDDPSSEPNPPLPRRRNPRQPST